MVAIRAICEVIPSHSICLRTCGENARQTVRWASGIRLWPWTRSCALSTIYGGTRCIRMKASDRVAPRGCWSFSCLRGYVRRRKSSLAVHVDCSLLIVTRLGRGRFRGGRRLPMVSRRTNARIRNGKAILKASEANGFVKTVASLRLAMIISTVDAGVVGRSSTFAIEYRAVSVNPNAVLGSLLFTPTNQQTKAECNSPPLSFCCCPHVWPPRLRRFATCLVDCPNRCVSQRFQVIGKEKRKKRNQSK